MSVSHIPMSVSSRRLLFCIIGILELGVITAYRDLPSKQFRIHGRFIESVVGTYVEVVTQRRLVRSNVATCMHLGEAISFHWSAMSNLSKREAWIGVDAKISITCQVAGI
jgi:hypothetical protein